MTQVQLDPPKAVALFEQLQSTPRLTHRQEVLIADGLVAAKQAVDKQAVSKLAARSTQATAQPQKSARTRPPIFLPQSARGPLVERPQTAPASASAPLNAMRFRSSDPQPTATTAAAKQRAAALVALADAAKSARQQAADAPPRSQRPQSASVAKTTAHDVSVSGKVRQGAMRFSSAIANNRGTEQQSGRAAALDDVATQARRARKPPPAAHWQRAPAPGDHVKRCRGASQSRGPNRGVVFAPKTEYNLLWRVGPDGAKYKQLTPFVRNSALVRELR